MTELLARLEALETELQALKARQGTVVTSMHSGTRAIWGCAMSTGSPWLSSTPPRAVAAWSRGMRPGTSC
jgi:hypothetical protein